MAYSPEFKASALIRLAENHNDYDLTAEELGCSPRALRNWASGVHVAKPAARKTANRAELPKKSSDLQKEDLSVADYLEYAVKHMLKNPPNELKGDAWAITVGVLMDKWLLTNNKATERREVISNLLESVPDDKYDNILREAERIIEDASRSPYSGNGKAAGY